MRVIYCNLWSGRLKNVYVWMICNEVSAVCCGEIDGCNPYRWTMSVMSCSCAVYDYPDVCDLEQPLYES